jgi:hypothetical protein
MMPTVTGRTAFARAAGLGLLAVVLSVLAPSPSAGGSDLPARARVSVHATVSDRVAPGPTWPVGLLAQPRAAVPVVAAVLPLPLLWLALASLPPTREPAQPHLAVAVPSSRRSRAPPRAC